MEDTKIQSKGVALITGAGQGIGRAIALRLASDGFDIALSDIHTNLTKLEAVAAEIRSESGDKGRITRVYTTPADVTIEDDVRAMVESTVQELGGLDVVVANAGIAHVSSLVDTNTADWDRLFAINVRGVFLTYKYAAQQMIALSSQTKRGRRIIGAGSLLGKRAEDFLSAYSASKFAVRGLTQSAALELGQYGITVNAYAPGPIDTDLLDGINAATMERTGIADPQAYNEKAFKRMALGYLGSPTDIAGLVSYLASEESHFITGQSITIDGGMHFD
ncbi:NAD(P)-binding protein [Hygrophoropsis aurantiaca]|uniref:NAD(P)-binding protein n=1 Tax=Hygrophoropsis aurantiaca TaxID=72124 RepID=A0ACB8ARW9_9AGAM|nr:NAD(P)-binding protein [Hygrophoropsis aurantiaca]